MWIWIIEDVNSDHQQTLITFNSVKFHFQFCILEALIKYLLSIVFSTKLPRNVSTGDVVSVSKVSNISLLILKIIVSESTKQFTELEHLPWLEVRWGDNSRHHVSEEPVNAVNFGLEFSGDILLPASKAYIVCCRDVWIIFLVSGSEHASQRLPLFFYDLLFGSWTERIENTHLLCLTFYFLW